MKFAISVEVVVERCEGKFASRADIESQIIEALEDADPGEFEGENEGLYEVVSWSVSP